jgi:hypothetical protein
MQTPKHIHEPLYLAMEFNSHLDVGTCDLTLCTHVLPFSHRVEDIESSILNNMSGSTVWHHGLEKCRFFTCEVRELKANVGAQKCDLEIKETRISKLNTKIEEQT